MGIESLPKRLEDRIVTVSAESYMRHYNLVPEEFHLKSIWCSRSDKIYESRIGHCNTPSLYNLMTETMTKHQAIAVTDIRISEVFIVNDGVQDENKAIMYGTAIVPRKK